VLKEDRVYNSISDRIIYRISNRDVKVDYYRIFKIAIINIYERGQDPISFTVKEGLRGEFYIYTSIVLYSALTIVLKDDDRRGDKIT